MNEHLLILGAGYSGRAIARDAIAAGHAVTGTTRSAQKAVALGAEGLSPLIFDGAMSDMLAEAIRSATYLVMSIAPGGDGDPVQTVARDIIAEAPHLRWIGYLSTVGVYGDHGGEWVDEETLCRPVSDRSKWRLDAENAWLGLGTETGVPTAVMRLSGIYGPGRNAFVNLSQGRARRIVKPGQVFNRIRVEDIAGATLHLSARGLGGIFNVTDDEPAPPQDLIACAAALMGVEPPPEIAFEAAEMTPMARSFYGESKRVANRKLRATGYAMRFANYRVSLDQLWREGIWRGESPSDD